jgi:hypothetical protein
MPTLRVRLEYGSRREHQVAETQANWLIRQSVHWQRPIFRDDAAQAKGPTAAAIAF